MTEKESSIFGKHHSEETKKKMSETRKGEKHPFYGKHHSEESRRKMSEVRKGKHHSEETKRKMGEIRKGKKLKPFSKEHKRKIGEARKGKHYSDETKRKMSESHKGHLVSEETRRKLSEAYRGEKSYLWKGGISFEPYSIDWTETLKRSIRERDHYFCQICWDYGDSVHHIDYNKKNCNPINLITLCNPCHVKTNQNRKRWKRFFMEGNLLRP